MAPFVPPEAIMKNPRGPAIPRIALLQRVGRLHADGREYAITSSRDRYAFAWVNVMASAEFGAMVSESGSDSPGTATARRTG